MRKLLYFLFLFLGVLSFLSPAMGTTDIMERDGKIYIVDRHGEEWDITDAVALGYNPKNFQYGIGRNAFKTLDDTSLSVIHDNVPPAERVIAFEDKSGGKTFSVDKLRRHEIANSWQNDAPVTVGY